MITASEFDRRKEYIKKPCTPKPSYFEGIELTPSGNIYCYGGAYNPTEKWDRENTSTRKEWFIEGMKIAQSITPSISERDIITSFVGVRTWNSRDPDEHTVEVAKKNARFIKFIIIGNQ